MADIFRVQTLDAAHSFTVSDAGVATMTGVAVVPIVVADTVVADAVVATTAVSVWSEDEQGIYLRTKAIDSGVVSLATGGAATTVTLGVPDGAQVDAVLVYVTTAVGGVNSTTGTLAFTGGSTTSVGAISAFTAGTAGRFFLSGSDGAVSGADADATFTLSGGGDNTPSAGAIRVVVWYRTIHID